MRSDDRIRVLHVIDSFDLGGGQTALLNLLRATNRERIEPEVACMHGRGVFWDEFARLGIPVHSLSPRKWLPLYILRLAMLIRRRRFAVVHCHLFGANWIAKPLATLLGVPVRVNHDQCNDALRHESRAALAVDRFTNRWSSHICAVSNSTRDFLLTREKLPEDRVSLVYNAIDLARFPAPQDPPPREPFVVLGVGRLHPQKNFTLFLEVAHHLLRDGRKAEFWIAGTGPEEQALRDFAKTLGITDSVRFLGHVSDTAALYAKAHVLLITSRYEGTPLTMLEAMSMRVPIVAPKIDGIAEIVIHEVDGLLAAPVHRQFAAAIERLMNDPALAATLAAAGERKVRERFSASIMAERVEAIYDRCLADAHRA